MPPVQNGVLAPGLRSGFGRHINGLDMHVLDAGFDGATDR
jgi:hypothetical protein